MSTLNQIKEGFGHSWQSLSEGWQHLRDRASQALTKFTPNHKDGEKDVDRQIAINSSRWGLLAAEIAEDDKNLTIKLEAPGLDVEDFDIEISGDHLRVSGEKSVKREQREEHYHLMECAYGRFQRSFLLPCEVNDAKSTAKYKNGVLKITLPKSGGSKRRSIPVDQ